MHLRHSAVELFAECLASFLRTLEQTWISKGETLWPAVEEKANLFYNFAYLVYWGSIVTDSSSRDEAKELDLLTMDFSESLLHFRKDVVQKWYHDVSAVVVLWIVSWIVTLVKLPCMNSWHIHWNIQKLCKYFSFFKPCETPPCNSLSLILTLTAHLRLDHMPAKYPYFLSEVWLFKPRRLLSSLIVTESDIRNSILQMLWRKPLVSVTVSNSHEYIVSTFHTSVLMALIV